MTSHLPNPGYSCKVYCIRYIGLILYQSFTLHYLLSEERMILLQSFNISNVGKVQLSMLTQCLIIQEKNHKVAKSLRSYSMISNIWKIISLHVKLIEAASQCLLIWWQTCNIHSTIRLSMLINHVITKVSTILCKVCIVPRPARE